MHVIIPARDASTRLPGKPLADIGGKPLLQHVWERACESGAVSVVIATDDERIRAAAARFGARACLTSAAHRSGTERLAEAISQLGLREEDVVVNLQGDEPLMPPGLIREVAGALARDSAAAVATAAHPISDPAEFGNPNVVKVVTDAHGHALYFSRAPIPYPRDGGAPRAFRHIGLYAYRAGFVARYVGWPPCPPEEAEQLEQLRVLWNGARIRVVYTDAAPGPGVDTPEDLARVRALIATRT